MTNEAFENIEGLSPGAFLLAIRATPEIVWAALSGSTRDKMAYVTRRGGSEADLFNVILRDVMKADEASEDPVLAGAYPPDSRDSFMVCWHEAERLAGANVAAHVILAGEDIGSEDLWSWVDCIADSGLQEDADELERERVEWRDSGLDPRECINWIFSGCANMERRLSLCSQGFSTPALAKAELERRMQALGEEFSSRVEGRSIMDEAIGADPDHPDYD